MADSNFRRQALKSFEEASGRGKGVKWEEFKEDTLHATWMTEQVNKFKKLNTLQIGGQAPGQGPDILKFIKQWDPENSSGAVKDAVDIMTKAKEAAKTDKLTDFIKPIKQTLGGDLFGKFQQAGAASKAGEKLEELKVEKDMLWTLIQEAMKCAGPEPALEVADLLSQSEIEKINVALDTNGTYTSTVMPSEFVKCINKMISTYFTIQEGTA